MSRQEQQRIEFRFYEMPQGMPALALLGDRWKQEYGKGETCLHFHNLLEIGYCHWGEGELCLGGEAAAFTKDTFSVIPKNFPHTTKSSPGVTAYWEYLFLDAEAVLHKAYPENARYVELLAGRINAGACLLEAAGQPEAAGLIKMIMEVLRGGRKFYREESEALIFALLMELAGRNPGEAKYAPFGEGSIRIAPALAYLDKNYAGEIRVGALAGMCHMSETHFRRIFVQTMHMSPVEYVNLVRIREACALMKRSGGSMLETGQQVGYASASSFNRNFQKIVGMSPYQWKRSPENYEGRLINYKVSVLPGW